MLGGGTAVKRSGPYALWTDEEINILREHYPSSPYVPLAAFRFNSASDPEFKIAWGLPNLRALWARDNLVKNAKIVSLL